MLKLGCSGDGRQQLSWNYGVALTSSFGDFGNMLKPKHMLFFFFPLLAGRFSSTLLLCKQWHFCSSNLENGFATTPILFSFFFFFIAIWWAKFFSFVSLNRAFCKWLWASCCCHCSHELMQKSQRADCSFVQVLCVVCASSVCSCLLAVDRMNIYARIRKHSFMQDCCLHAQCLGTLSWYRG